MSRPRLVVHAHFYQPFRTDPFSGHVPPDASAAPFRDWNERITAECYAANAASRSGKVMVGSAAFDAGLSSK